MVWKKGGGERVAVEGGREEWRATPLPRGVLEADGSGGGWGSASGQKRHGIGVRNLEISCLKLI